MSDRYFASLWLVGRFLSQPTAVELSVVDPAGILAAIGIEIEDEIRKTLHGGKSGTVVALCCGAVAVRHHAPAAHNWIGATALLRSPCARREYDRAQDFVDERLPMIARVAKVLDREAQLASSEALWIADEPSYRLVS